MLKLEFLRSTNGRRCGIPDHHLSKSTLQCSTVSSSKTTLSPFSRKFNCWSRDPRNWSLNLGRSKSRTRSFSSAWVIKCGCMFWFFFLESRKRPGVAQRVPGVLDSQISWHSSHEVGEVLSLRLYTQEMFLVFIFTRGWVVPRTMVRSEGICHWKIQWHHRDPGTVRLVALRLNHYATLGLSQLKHLTPNDHFSGRTAPLTYRCCIFYLFNRYTYWVF